MKFLSFLFVFLLVTGLYSFLKNQNEIAPCYINFNKASKLSMTSPERLPSTSEKVRQLQTEKGETEITRVDGYRILYNNKNKVAFINLKVELSDLKAYSEDTTNILENLRYLNTHSANMEMSDLIKLTYNGYTIYGLSRNTLDAGSNLGSFVMFPGNNITVYFDFSNLKPAFRNYESLDDYKSQRNSFFGAYTSHLNTCLNK